MHLRSHISRASAFALFCLMGMSGLAAPSQIDATLDDGEQLMFFPGPLMRLGSTAVPADSRPDQQTRFGWEVGGPPILGGDGWWALVCEQRCALYRTRLIVRAGRLRLRGGQEVATQVLQWSPLPPGLGQQAQPSAAYLPGSPPHEKPILLGLFRAAPGAQAPTFKPGPVPTLVHWNSPDAKGFSAAGQIRIRIPTNKAQDAWLVPQTKSPPAGSGSPAYIDGADSIDALELRVGGKRQRLSSFAFDSSKGFPNGDEILLWAGDLDGDGKIDLIVSHSLLDVDVAVYLSSAAPPGKLVGLAGSMLYRRAEVTEP